MIKLIIVHPQLSYLEKAQRHFSLLAQFANPIIFTSVEDIARHRFGGTVPGIALIDESLLSTKTSEKLAAIKQQFPHIMIHVLTGPLSRLKMLSLIKSGITGFSDCVSPLGQLAMDLKSHVEKGAYIDGSLFGNVIQDILIENAGMQMLPDISEKEWTIVTLLSNGYKYKEIESLTGLRLDTIRYYVKNIYRKFDVKSKTQLSSVVHGKTRF